MTRKLESPPTRKPLLASRPTRWNALHLLAFIGVFALIGALLVPRGQAASPSYSVQGNKIVDSNGTQVLVHGVDRPSLEWSCAGVPASGSGTGIAASDFTNMRNNWNADVVRIALDQDFWLTGAARYCASYRQNVAQAVANAEAAHLIVILDLHWSDQGNLQNTSPAQQCMADQNSLTFWQQVAGVYKSDPNVWFELYNEPHDVTWAQWLNGGPDCGFQTVGMQALYDTVRAAGANNIVIAGGTGWASTLNGITPISGTNIAYAVHIYRQTASQTFSVAGWDGQIGTIYNTAPVIATEFGDQVCDSTNYDQQLLSYFHSRGIGYTAWAWYTSGCGFPSIISDGAGDCYGALEGCTIQADMKSYPVYTPPSPTPVPTAAPATTTQTTATTGSASSSPPTAATQTAAKSSSAPHASPTPPAGPSGATPQPRLSQPQSQAATARPSLLGALGTRLTAAYLANPVLTILGIGLVVLAPLATAAGLFIWLRR